MNYVDLPALPGIVNGFKLRMEVAKAISQVEILAASGADASLVIEQLDGFFEACYAAVSATREIPRPQVHGSTPEPKPKKVK